MNALQRGGAGGDPQTLGDHLSELGRELEALVDKELELTRLEMKTAVRASTRMTFVLGGASTVMTVGLGFLLAALVIGLAELMPAWLAAGIVGVTLLAIGGGLAKKARSLMQKVGAVAEDLVEEAQDTERAVADGVH